MRIVRKIVIFLDVGFFLFTLLILLMLVTPPSQTDEGFALVFLIPYWIVWVIPHLLWVVYWLYRKRRGKAAPYPVVILISSEVIPLVILFQVVWP